MTNLLGAFGVLLAVSDLIRKHMLDVLPFTSCGVSGFRVDQVSFVDCLALVGREMNLRV